VSQLAVSSTAQLASLVIVWFLFSLREEVTVQIMINCLTWSWAYTELDALTTWVSWDSWPVGHSAPSASATASSDLFTVGAACHIPRCSVCGHDWMLFCIPIMCTHTRKLLRDVPILLLHVRLQLKNMFIVPMRMEMFMILLDCMTFESLWTTKVIIIISLPYLRPSGLLQSCANVWRVFHC